MSASFNLDGNSISIESTTLGTDYFKKERTIIALRVNGELKDLATDLATLDGATVQTVTIDSPDGLNILRHSTTHVLAQAVQQLYPDANLGLGLIAP